MNSSQIHQRLVECAQNVSKAKAGVEGFAGFQDFWEEKYAFWYQKYTNPFGVNKYEIAT